MQSETLEEVLRLEEISDEVLCDVFLSRIRERGAIAGLKVDLSDGVSIVNHDLSARLTNQLE